MLTRISKAVARRLLSREGYYFFRAYLDLDEPHVRDQPRVMAAYSTSGSRDLDLMYHPTDRECVIDGSLKIVSSDYVRRCHLDVISGYLPDRGRVLEVGCGNAINLIELRKMNPNLEFFGVDYVPQRLEQAQKYFGADLDGIHLQEGDVQHLDFNDKSFDVVFSIHCLEQCERILSKAVSEILRVAKKVVHIEPDFQNSNYAQRKFLKSRDYLRSLRRELLAHSDWKTTVSGLDTYFNPLNRSGLFVSSPPVSEAR
ncbi:MAG: class I SAM-dependent methyltransferase [Fuerstiella sp.]|nr:class I SAM-dependent methyltransferase [Fuerstiella sp.]